MSPEIIAALVTVIGLLFAALIAARVSYVGLLISKESSVSQFRQAWVDALREDIAELVGRYSTYPRAGHMNAAGRSELDLATATVKARIQMRMNPWKKEEHEPLRVALDELNEAAVKMICPPNLSDKVYSQHLEQNLPGLLRAHQNVIATSQELLKAEWERVKAGEPIYQQSQVYFKSVSTLITLILYAMAAMVVILFALLGFRILVPVAISLLSK
jgi:hypothetical protein